MIISSWESNLIGSDEDSFCCIGNIAKQDPRGNQSILDQVF